jgi:hypothetical protein
MVNAQRLEYWLWLGSIGFTILLIVRLSHTGLWRRYTCFFSLLCASVAQSLIHLPLKPNSREYAWAYLVTQPVIWILYILVVLELYSLVLKSHQGIATLGRWVLLVGSAVAVSLSMLSLVADLPSSAGQSNPLLACLAYYTVIERGLAASLVLFLLIIVAFLAWFPVPLSRNIILYATLYTAYFLGSSMMLLVRNVMGVKLTPVVSACLIGVLDLCLLGWVLLLNPEGEKQTVVLRRRWCSQDEERLVEQLDSLNATLLRATRK